MDFRNRNLRILNITHCDLDGSVAAVIVKRYYVGCLTHRTTYGRTYAESTLRYIDCIRHKIDGIVFTDFSPIDFKDELDRLNIPYIILDHHESALYMNDPKIGHIVNTKFCGAKLAYLYYSKTAKELDCLGELVELTNDYDMWIHADRRSKYLNTVHWTYYDFDAFYERFKYGFNGFTDNEKKELLKHSEQFKQMWENMPMTDLPHNGCICYADMFFSDLGLKLESEGYKWFIIFNEQSQKVHLRSSTDKIDFAKICSEELHRGGGHSKSASCDCSKDELESLCTRITAAVEKCFC